MRAVMTPPQYSDAEAREPWTMQQLAAEAFSALNRSDCRNVQAEARSWCRSARPPTRAIESIAGASEFHDAMAGGGVLVLAADSHAIWPTHHASFGGLLDATRWLPWDVPARTSPPLLSLSYVSRRVPNAFCAQPHTEGINCGTHDVLLLFRSTTELWELACAASLNDACGRSLCSPAMQALAAKDDHWRCPSSADEPEELRRAERLCTLPGGQGWPGRCVVPRSLPAADRRLAMEGAMRSFQRACRRRLTADENASFASQPTCQLTGRNKGALHNEVCQPPSSPFSHVPSASCRVCCRIDVVQRRTLPPH